MTDQPGTDRSEENPYATVPGQPPAQPWQPPTARYAPARPLPPLAPWGKRVGASLVDQFLVLVPNLLGILLWVGSFEAVGTDRLGRVVAGPTVAGNVGLVVCSAVGFGLQVWNRWVRQGRTGRSIGKQLVRIALVSELSRRPVGVVASFARDAVHTLDQLAFLGYLWPLWDAKRQTFADKIVRTVVVNG